MTRSHASSVLGSPLPFACHGHIRLAQAPPKRRLSRLGCAIPLHDPSVHSHRPRSASGCSCHTAPSRYVLVVSHHLDALLRSGSAGLLHPAASYGVRRVSARFVPDNLRCLTREELPSRHLSDPSKNTTRQQPCCVTAAFAFLMLCSPIRHPGVETLGRSAPKSGGRRSGASRPSCSDEPLDPKIEATPHALRASALAATDGRLRSTRRSVQSSSLKRRRGRWHPRSEHSVERAAFLADRIKAGPCTSESRGPL